MTRANNQISGLEITFYPNDHEPPHFHARKPGKWEIKVYFPLCTKNHLEFEEKWRLGSTGPLSKDRQRLCQYVSEHQAELQHEWETKVCQD